MISLGTDAELPTQTTSRYREHRSSYVSIRCKKGFQSQRVFSAVGYSTLKDEDCNLKATPGKDKNVTK